jgi:hypothetical protein
MAERHAAQAPALRERVHHSMFNVQCSMLDVQKMLYSAPIEYFLFSPER